MQYPSRFSIIGSSAPSQASSPLWACTVPRSCSVVNGYVTSVLLTFMTDHYCSIARRFRLLLRLHRGTTRHWTPVHRRKDLGPQLRNNVRVQEVREQEVLEGVHLRYRLRAQQLRGRRQHGRHDPLRIKHRLAFVCSPRPPIVFVLHSVPVHVYSASSSCSSIAFPPRLPHSCLPSQLFD